MCGIATAHGATIHDMTDQPTSDKTTTLWGQPTATVWLLVLAVLAVLYLAADLFIPIAFAILVNLLLSPVVQALQRIGSPPAVSAMVLIVTLLVALAAIIASLAVPAEEWLQQAPTTLRELQEQIRLADGHFAGIQQLAEEVDQLAATDTPTAQSVVVQGPGILENLLGGVPAVIAFVGMVVFLSFFLLAAGDNLLRRITRCGRTWTERRRIVSIARQTQIDLSRYLLTVTAINASLGAVVALTMYLLDVPNPLLWGAVTTLLNFAPYVGAMTMTAVLAVVGLTTFDSLGDALTVPLAFLVLTVIEGQLVTPSLLGRRMSLNPLVVFLSVISWGWLWGIAGALMAVPIVTSLKVVCDHVPSLRPIGNFLRRDEHPPLVATAAESQAATLSPNTSRQSKRRVGL